MDRTEKLADPTLISPVLVTGTQRSGTTLLYKILAGSKAYWAHNEAYRIHSLVFDARSPPQKSELDATLLACFGEKVSRHFALDFAGDRVQAFATMMRRTAEDQGRENWCLKDPRITYFLPQYAARLPDVKFVIIVRDPRAVCRSYMQSTGYNVGRPGNWLAAAERWQQEVTLQLEFAAQNPSRTLVIHYESLISHFLIELKRLCEFLSINCDPEMAHYYKSPAQIDINERNLNVLRPPDPTKIHAWRTRLTARQVSTIETVARTTMEKLGYTSECPPRRISSAVRLAARMHDHLCREYRWQHYKAAKLLRGWGDVSSPGDTGHVAPKR